MLRENIFEKVSFCFVKDSVRELPGPQTVDLTPVVSMTGTLFIAPSMLNVNTSQSKSNREKAKSFAI